MIKYKAPQRLKSKVYFFFMKCCLFLFVGTIASISTLSAQVIPLPKAILKTIPSTLIDPDNTFTLGLEVPLPKRWSVQQEIGWGHNSFNVYSYERDQYPNRQTWRFRSQIRYYFNDLSSPNGSFFAALEYFHKNVTTDQLQAVGRDCNTWGGCAYFEEVAVRTHRLVSAGHFKLGYVLITQKKMAIEIYAGLGVRGLRVKNNLDGTSLNLLRRDFFNLRPNQPGNYGTMPGLSAGIALGYAFRPRKPKSVSLP